MKKRIAKPKEKVLTFKISLLDNAAITRELALAEGQTLYTFAEAIIDSFDFALDHCFGFYSSFEKRCLSNEKY
jgi:hypothetical protein